MRLTLLPCPMGMVLISNAFASSKSEYTRGRLVCLEIKVVNHKQDLENSLLSKMSFRTKPTSPPLYQSSLLCPPKFNVASVTSSPFRFRNFLSVASSASFGDE